MPRPPNIKRCGMCNKDLNILRFDHHKKIGTHAWCRRCRRLHTLIFENTKRKEETNVPSN